MTIHKSQGSEFKNAIVVMPSEPANMLVRNLLYTGVTRAKKRVFIINEGSAMECAIRTNTIGKAGTEVTSDMLSAVQCDSKIVTAGKKTDTSSRFVTGANLKAVLNSGDSLRMDVSEGMPLTLSMLSVNGGSTVEMNMDPTKVAVTVPVTNVSGVTNDLKEGSRVNIYAMGVDTPGTTLLFQNMRVINTQKDNGTLSSATIEVDVDDFIYSKYFNKGFSQYKKCL